MARKLERHELTATVIIDDVINGRAAGELVNVTREGLMLIGDREFEPQAIFQFSLRLPTPLAGSDRLLVGADCLWSRPAAGSDGIWAGFQIIDVSDQALRQIDELIKLYRRD